jgi:hypothetical protein
VKSSSPPKGALPYRALDEARFGAARTLDLRATFPTVLDAVYRAEAWLRERQMAKAGDVLVITGRGKGSPGGIGVVREAVVRLLATLRRKGVVAATVEHTAGSFVVTLAPVRALFETVARSRTRARVPRPRPADPAELAALEPATRAQLRWLAERSLDVLGAPRTEPFVRNEMLRQFAVLASTVPASEPDRESRLRTLIAAASDAFDGER